MGQMEPTEREYWLQILPPWLVDFFLAPFSDEVGCCRAWIAWTLRCLAVSCVIATVVPLAVLDFIAAGLVMGAVTVLLLALSTAIHDE